MYIIAICFKPSRLWTASVESNYGLFFLLNSLLCPTVILRTLVSDSGVKIKASVFVFKKK